MFSRDLGPKYLLREQESALVRLLVVVKVECFPRELSHLEREPGGAQEG